MYRVTGFAYGKAWKLTNLLNKTWTANEKKEVEVYKSESGRSGYPLEGSYDYIEKLTSLMERHGRKRKCSKKCELRVKKKKSRSVSVSQG